MDTDSFVFQVETQDFCADTSNNVEDRFDTSAYSNEINRPIPIGKNKKVLGMMKDELFGKIMTDFVALRAKTYSYLDYDGKEEQKARGTKKCDVTRKIKFSDYKICLFDNNPVLRSEEVFKSEFHDVYILRLNKIALNSNDDKRLQTYDKVTIYPYGTGVEKVIKAELLSKVEKIY